MLKILHELESVIRDSQETKLEILYSEFKNDIFTEGTARLTFTKFDKEIIELILVAPTTVSIFNDDGCGDCISHIKAFEGDDSFEISLDPYDERINEIEERDNCVFKSRSYEIITTKK